MSKRINKFKAPKEKKVKPRANGTKTEAQFWQSIRQSLRNLSRWWEPAKQCKLEARRPNKSNNKRMKWEYQCSQCSNWFPESFIKIDHTIPCGALNCSDDLKGFVERLFVEKEGYTVMCDDCHQIKTNREREEFKQLKEYEAKNKEE